MANTRRGSPRRARKSFSITQAYRLAGPDGKALEFAAAFCVYGCGAWEHVASRLVLSLLDDLQEVVAKYGLAEGARHVEFGASGRLPEGLETRPQRGDRYRPKYARNDVLPGASEKPGDQKPVP